MSEIRCQRSEIRCQMSDVRGQMSDVRDQMSVISCLFLLSLTLKFNTLHLTLNT